MVGIEHFLGTKCGLDVERTFECTGLAVRTADGSTKEIATHWGTNTPEVGGTLTSRGVIDFVLNDEKNIGLAFDGDYSSECLACNQ